MASRRTKGRARTAGRRSPRFGGRGRTRRATGQSDTEHSTYIYVPQLRAVVAGDIAYNDVHSHVGATDHTKPLAWIDTLRGIAALAEADSPSALIEAVLAKHGGRLNVTTLYHCAYLRLG